uniref:Mineralocorticoid receptor isoform X1 n=2 Tax=Petromyzon marinus TaxID=7757 RepID=A0AAJ7WVD4_PETMA|nr:mineralocorticoid receptor isoform X1 [Petromyzon marinus]XP_032811367.1 mineralocorticoid receptor isoform X1 [Petromyzon marinus]XP_032811368.1 mineralocorticoid receptor isoform X1 [Petromyzon marinus]XP_032811369.1 mineralocorticoid receptor isoform X1 [Petromyzon marinus]XP_032811370.1 mineralocorticoid receptor isoform X1 [Petromyzon marinus]
MGTEGSVQQQQQYPEPLTQKQSELVKREDKLLTWDTRPLSNMDFPEDQGSPGRPGQQKTGGGTGTSWAELVQDSEVSSLCILDDETSVPEELFKTVAESMGLYMADGGNFDLLGEGSQDVDAAIFQGEDLRSSPSNLSHVGPRVSPFPSVKPGDDSAGAQESMASPVSAALRSKPQQQQQKQQQQQQQQSRQLHQQSANISVKQEKQQPQQRSETHVLMKPEADVGADCSHFSHGNMQPNRPIKVEPQSFESPSEYGGPQLMGFDSNLHTYGDMDSSARHAERGAFPGPSRGDTTASRANVKEEDSGCDLHICTPGVLKRELDELSYCAMSMSTSVAAGSPFVEGVEFQLPYSASATSFRPSVATSSASGISNFSNGNNFGFLSPNGVQQDGFPYPGFTSPAQSSVPPQKACLICSDEASGCHYGVLTCGSCKVFFKRAVEGTRQGQHNYLCAGRNDCIIDKIRRKNCPACRLRKCIQAGMTLGARKLKKQGRVKGENQRSPASSTATTSSATPQPSSNSTAVTTFSPPPTGEPIFSPTLIAILQAIEPEVVMSGYDNTRSQTTAYMLSSLNRLCDKQLVSIVKWAKSLPGFRNLHIDDQMVLIQYSWMGLMSFAMSWRSFQHTNSKLLYFAPDLVFDETRMQQSAMYQLCVEMRQVSEDFMKLQVTSEEFLCMKAILLLSTVPQEGLKSQGCFEEMRISYIRELNRTIARTEKNAVQCWQRFYQLTKLLDCMQDLVSKLLEFCFATFTQTQVWSVEFPDMMAEIISAQLPRIMAGEARALHFHKK